MKKIMFLLFILVALVSCKTKQLIPGTSVDHTSTNTDHSIKHDSIYIYKSDSIYVRQKGDTVFYTHYKTLYTDRWHTKTDSINNTDTLKIKTTVCINVEKKLTWLQSAEIWIGKIFLLLAFLALLFFGAKYFLKLRKIIP